MWYIFLGQICRLAPRGGRLLIFRVFKGFDAWVALKTYSKHVPGYFEHYWWPSWWFLAPKSVIQALFGQKYAQKWCWRDMNSLLHFEHDSWKTALVRGFLSKSFSTRPMVTILFSTPCVKSGDCFENKRHGHNCSEKFCRASGSQMFEKVTEPSQTPDFEIFWIFQGLSDFFKHLACRGLTKLFRAAMTMPFVFKTISRLYTRRRKKNHGHTTRRKWFRQKAPDQGRFSWILEKFKKFQNLESETAQWLFQAFGFQRPYKIFQSSCDHAVCFQNNL